MTVEQRFEARVDRSGGPDVCHLWTGNVGEWGHPTMHFTKKASLSVRRLAWRIAHGEIPSGRRWVTTTCGSRICLNPKHLAIRATRDDVSRFWEKVDKRSPEECWPWIGYIDKRGYGRFSPLGGEQTKQAHRVAWEIANDKPIPLDVPVELVVMHSCDFPRCVNPAHLSLGTDADNQADMDRKGRRSRGEKHRIATAAARARSREQAIANGFGAPRGFVTHEQEADILRHRENGATLRELAGMYAVSQTTIWNASKRATQHKSVAAPSAQRQRPASDE